MSAPRQLFHGMLRIRIIEESIADLYSEQEMRCPVHLCIGQEAVAVGVCAALTHQDYAFSGHRSHGHYLAKGGNLKLMLAEIYGKATGCCLGKGGSMHLVDLGCGFLGATPIVASTIPIGVGTAFASSLRRESRVTAVFFGEGATEEGVFHESLNFAALRKLPVIFVCENNLYSVYSPLEVRQPAERRVGLIAQAHGIESFHGDGNDVAAVAKLTEQAVQRARQDGGPSFLEFDTYRWREHCGPFYDNDLGYRTGTEFQKWKERCPIDRCRQRLLNEGVVTARELAEMETNIKNEIADAVHFAKTSPFPDDSQLNDQVYAPVFQGYAHA